MTLSARRIITPKSGTRSVVYSVMEQDVLDLFQNDVIGKPVDPHIAKIFDTNAATDRLSKTLLTSSSFMVPILMFVQRKTNSGLAD